MNVYHSFVMSCLLIISCTHNYAAQPWTNEPTDFGSETKAIIDDIAMPMIAFDSMGNAITVWYDAGGIRYAIYAARYVANSGWQAKVMLSNNVDMSYPQISFDTKGNAFVFWCEDSRGGYSDVFVARYVVGSGWKPKVNLSSTTMRASNPSIAVDSAGNAIMVWRELAVGGYTNYASRFLISTSSWQSKIKIS